MVNAKDRSSIHTKTSTNCSAKSQTQLQWKLLQLLKGYEELKLKSRITGIYKKIQMSGCAFTQTNLMLMSQYEFCFACSEVQCFVHYFFFFKFNTYIECVGTAHKNKHTIQPVQSESNRNYLYEPDLFSKSKSEHDQCCLILKSLCEISIYFMLQCTDLQWLDYANITKLRTFLRVLSTLAVQFETEQSLYEKLECESCHVDWGSAPRYQT